MYSFIVSIIGILLYSTPKSVDPVRFNVGSREVFTTIGFALLTNGISIGYTYYLYIFVTYLKLYTKIIINQKNILIIN